MEKFVAKFAVRQAGKIFYGKPSPFITAIFLCFTALVSNTVFRFIIPVVFTYIKRRK
jgi:hypothetical protein